MTRRKVVLAATITAVLGLPAGAAAMINEIGYVSGETTLPDPSCPAKPCIVHSRTTGYQVKVGEARDTHVVKENGRIVAWTIKLSSPTKEQIAFFEKGLGGPASAQITVVRPGNKLYARVLAQGDVQQLTSYFGTTAQFALKTSIPVAKGNVIALTVPTWAPALANNQAGTTSFRATRPKGGCQDYSTPTQQTGVNNVTRFYCLYRFDRLTYTATIVTDPQPGSPSKTVTVDADDTAPSKG